MEESQDKFSLHEMQKKMNGRDSPSEPASERIESAEEAPGLFARGGVRRPTPPVSNGNLPPQAIFSQRAADGEPLQLRRILRVLRRRWMLIVLIIILVPAVIGLFDQYLRDKVYVTEVNYRELAEQELGVLQIGSLELSPSPNLIDNVEAMIEETEVENQLLKLIAAESRRIKNEISSLKNPKKQAEGTELVANLDRMVEAKLATPPDNDTYMELRGRITTKNIKDNTVKIYLRGSYPQVHKIVARLLLDALNSYYSNTRLDLISERLAQLEELRDKNQEKLENIREEITTLDEEISGLDINVNDHYNQVIHIKERQLLESEKLWDLDSRLQLLKDEYDWEGLKKKYKIKEEKDIRVVFVQGNPERMKWQKLEQERAALLTHYTSAHPQVQRLENDIRAIKDELIASGQVNSAGELPDLPSNQEEVAIVKIQNLLQEVTLAKMRVERISTEIQSARRLEDKAMMEMEMSKEKQKLLRNYEYEREELMDQQHNYRLTHRQLVGLIDDTNTIFKQVESDHKFEIHGKIRSELESPKLILDITIGAIFGLMLGYAMAFIMESVDNRLHTPFDVYYHLRLNYLGVVPFWGEKEAVVISPDKPDSQIAEIYAHLRNNIRYARSDSPEKCLLIASATQGEGKSTISANLASSYALEGNNVVLIDADLRRPRGHKLINIFKGERNMEYGLCDYLTEEVKFNEIIYSTSVPGLSLIPAGSRVRNPAKLMGSPEMMALIKHAEENFDIVIIDCPAVLPVVDATTLSGHVRGVLMVIAAEEVEIGAVRMALYRLQHVGSPIVGAVLNKVKERSTSYYYYGYRDRSGYYYSPYSDPKTSNDKKEDNA
ncbi:MAG: polysaccharide biosynthesis tyrosine autokinase [Planctomycetes bacterium]|nr:polysaccharide biosynthesis tyrosine autokinase [Planctomycetota bacterium]